MSASSGEIVEYVFEQPSPVPDYWGYSDIELARSCRMIAESRSGPRNALLRADAVRLFLMWREAINAHRERAWRWKTGQRSCADCGSGRSRSWCG